MLNELLNPSAEDNAALTEKMTTLSQNVQHHVQEEEGKMFATAEQLGQDQLSQLGEQLQQRKQQLMKQGDNMAEPKS
jgi:hemerythrin-like domain-containing protein